jgi:hypothetical protein
MRYSNTLQCTVTLLIAHMRGATVPHRAADCSWARWAEATIRQDEATLGFDPIGLSYAIDHSPIRRTKGTGHVIRRMHHHYPVLAFNALAIV